MRYRSLERTYPAMKRFASLTTAALVGCLISAETNAKADSTMYLVPISDLSATYAPGSSVQCAAVLDLGVGNLGFLSLPTAVAYLPAQFGSDFPTVAPNQTEDPTQPGKGIPFWGHPLSSYNTTATRINGAVLDTIQESISHVATNDGKGHTVAIPAGTYTIATFTFPISPDITGNTATVYLPTPFGYDISANTADGYYINAVGPQFSFFSKNTLGLAEFEPLAFPNADGKYNALTFKIAAVPEPGSIALLLGIGTVGIGVLRKRRKP